jgi:hypothetical protein
MKKNCAPGKGAKKPLPSNLTRSPPTDKGGKMQGVRSTTRNAKY